MRPGGLWQGWAPGTSQHSSRVLRAASRGPGAAGSCPGSHDPGSWASLETPFRCTLACGFRLRLDVTNCVKQPLGVPASPACCALGSGQRAGTSSLVASLGCDSGQPLASVGSRPGGAEDPGMKGAPVEFPPGNLGGSFGGLEHWGDMPVSCPLLLSPQNVPSVLLLTGCVTSGELLALSGPGPPSAPGSRLGVSEALQLQCPCLFCPSALVLGPAWA